MNNNLESKYEMYLIVQEYLSGFSAITSMLPGFDGYTTDFTKNNGGIKTIKEQLEVDISGISKNKELLRASLIAKTVNVCEKVEVYAKLNGNVVLANEVHYPESELNRVRGTSLTDKATTVFNKATMHVTELEKYGVTPTMLAELKVSIDVYRDAIPSMSISKSNKKLNYENLKGLVKANDDILEKMDLLVEIIKKTNPDFYKGYKNTRRIIAKRTGKLALRAKVTSAYNGAELKGARATIMPNIEMGVMGVDAKNAKPIFKKTAEKGIFRIKNMPEGTYTVTIEKVGYIPKTLTINVVDGEMAKLEVKLDRN